MAERRTSRGLRWVFLLLLAELALLGVFYYLRDDGKRDDDPPASFSRVQTLNLQSLINAKGYPCPTAPYLRYAQRSQGVVILAVCRLPGGERRSFEIDFKGHVKPL